MGEMLCSARRNELAAVPRNTRMFHICIIAHAIELPRTTREDVFRGSAFDLAVAVVIHF